MFRFAAWGEVWVAGGANRHIFLGLQSFLGNLQELLQEFDAVDLARFKTVFSVFSRSDSCLNFRFHACLRMRRLSLISISIVRHFWVEIKNDYLFCNTQHESFVRH